MVSEADPVTARERAPLVAGPRDEALVGLPGMARHVAEKARSKHVRHVVEATHARQREASVEVRRLPVLRRDHLPSPLLAAPVLTPIAPRGDDHRPDREEAGDAASRHTKSSRRPRRRPRRGASPRPRPARGVSRSGRGSRGLRRRASRRSAKGEDQIATASWKSSPHHEPPPLPVRRLGGESSREVTVQSNRCRGISRSLVARPATGSLVVLLVGGA